MYPGDHTLSLRRTSTTSPLDRVLLEYLGEQPPERFLYVSFGFLSFVEDTARLTSGGKLRLSGLTAFNLMPFTEHVETVARFERA